MKEIKIDYNDLIAMLWNQTGSWNISVSQDSLIVKNDKDPDLIYRIDKTRPTAV